MDSNTYSKTGGPAFPTVTDGVCIDEGVTVRDFMAAHALLGLLGAKGVGPEAPAIIARACYIMADAMLLERQAP